MKSVVLDFGNVVAFFDHRRACTQLASLSAGFVSEDEVFDAVFRSTLESDFDCGKLTPRVFIERLRTLFHLTALDSDIVKAWCDIFWANDEVVSLIPRLKSSGYRLILASNTNELHYQWFSKQFAEHLAHFDAFVLSWRLGFRKPAPPFFDECVAASLGGPQDCILIDDRPDFVEAARQVGIRGLCYVSGNDLLSALASAGVKVQ